MSTVHCLAETGSIGFQQVTLIAAIVLFIFVIINMRRRRRPLDGSPRQYRREIESAAETGAGLRNDLDQLMIQLEELSRRINSQVETRFAKLEQTIADADRRIAALRILIDASQGGTTGHSRSADAPPPDPGRTGDGPTGQSAAAATAPETTPILERHGVVYQLADRGLSAVDIAKELGRRPGEVELILNLRGASDPIEQPSSE